MEQKFIVIEGIDWSWKTTQVNELKKFYEASWKKVLVLDYPRYDEPITIGVKRYLNWEYWDINNVSIYQASILYAMDRLDNYLKNLKSIWNDYDVILGNRYTTSNLIHQWWKLLEILNSRWYLEDEEITNWTMFEFKNWLEDLEYRDLSLPIPTKVIFLDVAENISLKNIEERWNKKDLHETKDHLQWAYEAAKFWSDNLPTWEKINCLSSGKMKDIKLITKEIIEKI